ncbi:MAG: glycosyltransferase family 9 protein [Chitinophagales bacterium]
MVKKILIIRFSSIGDIVLTTPVIRCIKKQLNAEIHFATKKQFASVLSANPYISKLHVLEDKMLPELVDALNKEKFDLIVDLHNNLRTFLIKSNLGLESRSFNKLNFQKWLMVKFKINRLPEKHIVDRYLETVKDFGVANDGEGLDYFIPEKEMVDVQTLPVLFQNGFIAFVIGAMHFTKKLPAEKAIELCSKFSLPVVLIGGREDFDAGEKIASSNIEKIYNACGKYSINQSASLLQQAIKVYTHDTGMMHIAAAFKKNIVSIWGNTIPEFGMYPYFGAGNNLMQQRQSGKIMEVNGLKCRPCSKIGFERCPLGHFNCMMLQDISPLKN